jgi:hypothetical protein
LLTPQEKGAIDVPRNMCWVVYGDQPDHRNSSVRGACAANKEEQDAFRRGGPAIFNHVDMIQTDARWRF